MFFQNTFWNLKEWPEAHRSSMKHSWSGTVVVICHCPMAQFRNPRNILRKAGQTLHYPAAKSSVAVNAHNEDGPPELDGHCCWLSVRQENGSKFSTFHYPGMLPDHTFSVNSYGLVQTINNIRVDDLQSGIPHWC